MAGNLQVLRTIDKMDKLGIEGVRDLLVKSESEFGAGLMHWQADMIADFLATSGDTNMETINNLRGWFVNAHRVRSRIDLMVLLEETMLGPAETAWDRLLAMRPNADETWANGGRPANIAWALDDLLQRIAADA